MKFDRLFLIVALTTLLCACAVMVARADMVTDWNDKVVTAGVKASQAPFVHTRSAAIVHVAMFDAVNWIDGAIHPTVCNHPLLLARRVKRLQQPLPTGLGPLVSGSSEGFRQLLSNIAGNGARRAAEVERDPAW